MEMCYDGALVMPSSYAVMNEEEMTYVEGGAGVIAIITAVIAAIGASYGAGQAVGQRLYYNGITTSEKWSKYKWKARAAVVPFGACGGAFILGLENKLYSMITGK